MLPALLIGGVQVLLSLMDKPASAVCQGGLVVGEGKEIFTENSVPGRKKPGVSSRWQWYFGG